MPSLERHGQETVILGAEAWVFIAVRYSDEAPVAGVAPRMIRAGQDLRAAARSVDEARPAMAADVREGANFAIVAPDNENAFAEIFERPPFARLRNFAFVADDLRRCAQEGLLLRLEEFRIVVEPAGQAQIVKRILAGRKAVQRRCHAPALPRDGRLPQSEAAIRSITAVRRELGVDDRSRRKLALADSAAGHSGPRTHQAEVAPHEAARTLQVGEDLAAVMGDRLHRWTPRAPAAPAPAPAATAPAAAPAPPGAPSGPQRVIVGDAFGGDLEHRTLEHLAVAELRDHGAARASGLGPGEVHADV